MHSHPAGRAKRQRERSQPTSRHKGGLHACFAFNALACLRFALASMVASCMLSITQIGPIYGRMGPRNKLVTVLYGSLQDRVTNVLRRNMVVLLEHRTGPPLPGIRGQDETPASYLRTQQRTPTAMAPGRGSLYCVRCRQSGESRCRSATILASDLAAGISPSDVVISRMDTDSTALSMSIAKCDRYHIGR